MTATIENPALADLPPIGLPELTERAALQTRVDRKYLLPTDAVDVLLRQAEPDTRVLEIDGLRSFGYESLYFDTQDLVTYLLAAHRRRRRFKVRMRTYLDSSLCWLEVKTRGPRKSTIKDRLPYQAEERENLAPGRRFVDTVLTERSIPGSQALCFGPALTTRYRRSTLYLPSTDSRVTIDTELTWDDGRRRLWLPEVAVIETKTGSVASHMDRLLWTHGYRPTRISKYATGLAALRPDLPATPWRRTLRRLMVSAEAC